MSQLERLNGKLDKFSSLAFYLFEIFEAFSSVSRKVRVIVTGGCAERILKTFKIARVSFKNLVFYSKFSKVFKLETMQVPRSNNVPRTLL